MKHQIQRGRKRLGGTLLSIAAGLLFGFSLLTLSACGSSGSAPTEPPIVDDPGDDPVNTTPVFTADGGTFIRKRVTVPAKMTFKVTGVDGDDDRDMQPIVYFYDDRGFTGGRGGAGFNGDLRNQKLKVYDVNDDLMGFEGERYGYDWNSSDTVSVTIEWTANSVTAQVGDRWAVKNGPVANTFTIGVGLPPSARPGWTGLTFTDIVWPAGSIDAGHHP